MAVALVKNGLFYHHSLLNSTKCFLRNSIERCAHHRYTSDQMNKRKLIGASLNFSLKKDQQTASKIQKTSLIQLPEAIQSIETNQVELHNNESYNKQCIKIKPCEKDSYGNHFELIRQESVSSPVVKMFCIKSLLLLRTRLRLHRNEEYRNINKKQINNKYQAKRQKQIDQSISGCLTKSFHKSTSNVADYKTRQNKKLKTNKQFNNKLSEQTIHSCAQTKPFKQFKSIKKNPTFEKLPFFSNHREQKFCFSTGFCQNHLCRGIDTLSKDNGTVNKLFLKYCFMVDKMQLALSINYTHKKRSCLFLKRNLYLKNLSFCELNHFNYTTFRNRITVCNNFLPVLAPFNVQNIQISMEHRACGNIHSKPSDLSQHPEGDATNKKKTPHSFKNEIQMQNVLHKPVHYAHTNRQKENSINDTELLIEKNIVLDPNYITISNLAQHIQMSVSEIEDIAQILFENTPVFISPATRLTIEETKLICEELGRINQLHLAYPYGTTDSNIERPPIITIMGHVNHGKTSLLDVLRKSSIAKTEAGNITQTVAAFQIISSKTQKKMTIIDTPGHAAFNTMRERGGLIADIIILMIAVNEGVQVQTYEAIKIINSARIPYIIALNKTDCIDLSNLSKIERVIREKLNCAQENPCIIPISVRTGYNLNKLEDELVNVSNQLKLYSNINSLRPKAFVLEARNHSHTSVIYTCILQRGNLKIGSPVIVARRGGRIQQILGTFNNHNGPTPGQPFDILVVHNERNRQDWIGDIIAEPGGILLQLQSTNELKNLEQFFRTQANELQYHDNSQLSKDLCTIETTCNPIKTSKSLVVPPKPSNEFKKTRKKLKKIEVEQNTIDLSEPSNIIMACPKIPLFLIASDTGGMEALVHWINSFNYQQEKLFFDKILPKISKDRPPHKHWNWKPTSDYASLHVPKPFKIMGQCIGRITDRIIDYVSTAGIPVFVFDPVDAILQTKIQKEAILFQKTKLRHHNVIYEVFDDIQVLFDYYFGPKICRSRTATSTPVTQTCEITLRELCTVAEVTLLSGTASSSNLTIDVWRHTNPPLETISAKKSEAILECIKKGAVLESIRQNDKPCTTIKAPGTVQFVIREFNPIKNDIIHWYTSQPREIPFNDEKFTTICLVQ